MTAAGATSRNAHIDSLRGVAIACVMVLHFALAYGLKNSPLEALPGWLLRGISWNGNYGVTMFFAVSGFLITSRSLGRWGTLAQIDVREFYLLRGARILPPLLVALSIIVMLGLLGVPHFDNADGAHRLGASYFVIAVGSILSFWHNVLVEKVGWFNYCLNIYWSLSVEEVFYLAFPLIGLALRRTWLVAAVCVVLIVAGPVWRATQTEKELAYFACFDAIAMGCIAALLAHRVVLDETKARALRWFCVAALAVVYLRGIRGNEVFGFSMIGLGSAGFAFGAAHDQTVHRTIDALFGPLRWLGRQSYELYLFHIIVLALMRNAVTRGSLSYEARLPWLGILFGASALLAALAARFVSAPASRALRTRYAKHTNRSSLPQGAVTLPLT